MSTYFSLRVYLYVIVSLRVCVSVNPYLCVSICAYPCLCFSVSPRLCVSVSVYMRIRVFRIVVSLCRCVSVSLVLCVSSSRCVSVSMYLCVRADLSLCLFVSPISVLDAHNKPASDSETFKLGFGAITTVCAITHFIAYNYKICIHVQHRAHEPHIPKTSRPADCSHS